MDNSKNILIQYALYDSESDTYITREYLTPDIKLVEYPLYALCSVDKDSIFRLYDETRSKYPNHKPYKLTTNTTTQCTTKQLLKY